MRRLAAVLFSMALALPLQAQDLTKSAVIDTLLVHSRVNSQLGAMSEGFERNLSQMNLNLTPSDEQTLREEGVAAFDSTKLAEYVRSYFIDNYEAELAAEAVRELQSDLVQRVESMSRHDVQPQELRQYARSLRTRPPEQERLQLIQRMSRAQQAPQFYVDNVMGLSRAVADAAEVLSGTPIDSQVLPDSSQIARSARNMAIVSFLYMYEDVPQQVLEEYVSLFESEAGQWFVNTYSKAVSHAIEQASTNLKRELESVQ